MVFFQKWLQVDGWGKKGPSPLLEFLSRAFCCFPGWGWCWEHGPAVEFRVTDLGHQIPQSHVHSPFLSPAVVMDLREVSELYCIQGPSIYSSALDTVFSLSCRLPGSAPNKFACISLEVCCVFPFCKLILFLSVLSPKHTHLFATFPILFSVGSVSGSLHFILLR